MINQRFARCVASMLLTAFAAFGTAHAAQEAAGPTASASKSPHTIGLAKLIVGDLKKTQTFYESMFGMKEVGHYSAAGVYDEPIMGFGSGARLALFQPLARLVARWRCDLGNLLEQRGGC